MLQTTAQRFGSLGKSFGAPAAAAAVIGAALLASDTSDTSETAWSPAAACLLPDVLPVAGTLLSYGGNRQLAAGGTVTHSGALSIGANALTCGAITASGAVKLTDGTYTAGLIPYTSGGTDAILVRNSTNTGNANFEAAKGTFATLRSIGAVVFEGALTSTSSIQETPTQSALDPTTTNIPSGKRQGWYNSTLAEFRDWVNIGGTLLKSAAYT